MDGPRFDRLARILNSRRTGLSGLLGGSLALLGLRTAYTTLFSEGARSLMVPARSSAPSTPGRSRSGDGSGLLHLGVIIALLVASIAPLGSVTGGVAMAPPPPETDLIVVLTPGTDPAAVARAAGVRPRHLYQHVFPGFAAHVPEQALEGLRRNPRVVLISVDRPVTIAQQALPAGVDRVEADRFPGAVGSGSPVNADVAVLDTGIDVDHPDLSVAGGVDCTGGGSSDDGHGHGTHVAGTIGAQDNSGGVVGVAPGARLWAVKVLDAAGSGSWATVICGLDWVYAERATIDVANLSLGGPGRDGSCGDEALHQAICRVVAGGIPVVAAAGNDSQDAGGFVPAAYEEVVAVSAFADFDGQPGGLGSATCQTSDGDDRFAAFSNYGAEVDLAAPGRCVRSTYIGGGTAWMSGTSMAAPHVAGAAALYKAANPLADAAQVRLWLLGAASEAQGSAVGFSGDPDAFPERVLNLDLGTTYPAEPTLLDPAPPPPARAPIARANSYRVAEDKVLRRAAPGVLGNDSDPEGGRLRARVIRKPAHGALTLRADGSFVYRPKRNFSGRDVFTYEAVDNQGLKDQSTVRVRVLSRPD